MRSGSGASRTILLIHIISDRPSKQTLMVRTFLKVYMDLGSYFFVSARTNKRQHHQSLPVPESKPFPPSPLLILCLSSFSKERDGGNTRAVGGATSCGWRGGKSHDTGARARVELLAKHATIRPAELT